MKKYILTLAALAFLCGTASAQGILGRLGERAKQAVENNVGNKIEKGVNDLLDGKKKDKDEKDTKQSRGNDDEAAVEVDEADATTQNAKNDFVRGSVIPTQQKKTEGSAVTQELKRS